ncbi:LysR family transcriptional regulator [Puniceibacterium sp. IMCC21224]|uniref:LysR family transcriptional regulator n=1 Tax=Puniceibacterium sp. IMCC21224 TaxID=1618204 RepID=UPI0018CEE8AA|nr:LysR family transcriptional regulator [Puniceibacterium sp. IMCC21224]
MLRLNEDTKWNAAVADDEPAVFLQLQPEQDGPNLRIDLFSLQLFLRVCEAKSIARAADLENIAASAVSKRISDLETRLRIKLFHRTSRGLEPTSAAQSLIHHARVLMRDITQMETELAHHAAGVSGQVRIYASVSTIVQHLPVELRSFIADHPSIGVELQECSSTEAVDAVCENLADIGIFGGVVPREGLRIIPYLSDRIVVLTPPDHPLSTRSSVRFEEFPDYNLIGPKKGSYLDHLVLRAASELDRPLKIPIRLNGFDTVASMVETGLGIGLVPEGCAARYASGGNFAVLRLDDDWALRQWNICVQEGATLPPPVRLLLDHLTRGIA